MHLSMFSPRTGGTWGEESLRAYSGDYTAKTVTALGNLTDEFDRRHLRCFSEKTEEIMKLCLNLKARHMGRELNCLIP